ncbi:MAG: hypothetical protein HQK51_21915 [Oligoflexia bacterium]|nr:hypothetical protein [Oligoflexia bacterium]
MHQFIIYGKSYGTTYDSGIMFSDNPKNVLLRNFHFCLNERFIYQYNFFVNWELEIRLEQKLIPDTNKLYPICIDGHMASPPEYCKGALEFMKLADYYSVWRIEEIFYDLLKKYKNKKIDNSDFRAGLRNLNYWINRHKFDRRETNKILKKFATKDPEWKEYMEEVILL